MKITVKILQGAQCTVEVPETATVPDLKQEVSTALGIPPSQQRLVLRGRPLPDDKSLSACGVSDGQRLFLVVKKAEGSSQSDTAASAVDHWKPLEVFLAKHYKEGDAKLVLEEFKKDFKKTMNNWSLDDVERWSAAMLETNQS